MNIKQLKENLAKRGMSLDTVGITDTERKQAKKSDSTTWAQARKGTPLGEYCISFKDLMRQT